MCAPAQVAVRVVVVGVVARLLQITAGVAPVVLERQELPPRLRSSL